MNETCFCRSALLVVDPHSMSTVPFAISGIRLDDVTGLISTLRFGIFSSVLIASTTLPQISIA